MNVVPKERQIRALSALVEGNSIRSIERMTGTHQDTITRLLCRIGDGCARLLDEKMRGLPCINIQTDEIWCYVRKKRARLTEKEKLDRTIGDQYVFVGMCADTKLVISHRVGKRDRKTAAHFMVDLQSRLTNRIQLTTDGFDGYLSAVEDSFGSDVDYAQLVKIYGSDGDAGPGYYAPPPKVTEVVSTVINESPDPWKVSTSYVERQNLTMRMQMRRFTRFTNAFSKKLENLKAALNLHFAHYNLCRVHGSIRVTPAMEAGTSDHVWTMAELLDWGRNS